jgi:prepilin-type N-terminal cleavage/methylation domain-containing protein
MVVGKNQNKGFTLVEMLVVIFIMVLFSVLVISAYGNGQQKYALNSAVQKLAADLHSAQNLALSGTAQAPDTPVGYGIHVKTATQYVLFYNIAGMNPPDQYRYRSNPPVPSKEIGTINLSSGATVNLANDVFFTPPDPTTYFNGSPAASGDSLNFTITMTGGLSQTITVYTNGRIEF